MKKIFNKKVFAVCMTVLLSTNLFACSGNNSSNSDAGKDDGSIELSLSNYEDYLTATVESELAGEKLDNEFTQVKSTLLVEGASDNFIYEDVTVEATITITYTDLNPRIDDEETTITETITTTCNVAGDSSEDFLIDLLDNDYTNGLWSSCSYSITNVSGSVKPAN